MTLQLQEVRLDGQEIMPGIVQTKTTHTLQQAPQRSKSTSSDDVNCDDVTTIITEDIAILNQPVFRRNSCDNININCHNELLIDSNSNLDNDCERSNTNNLNHSGCSINSSTHGPPSCESPDAGFETDDSTVSLVHIKSCIVDDNDNIESVPPLSDPTTEPDTDKDDVALKLGNKTLPSPSTCIAQNGESIEHSAQSTSSETSVETSHFDTTVLSITEKNQNGTSNNIECQNGRCDEVDSRLQDEESSAEAQNAPSVLTEIKIEDKNPSLTGNIAERKSPHLEGQRQRSLGPESSRIDDSSAKCNAANKQLQRSSSYPQVKPKLLFTPIRPSPEESGLFREDVHQTVVSPSDDPKEGVLLSEDQASQTKLKEGRSDNKKSHHPYHHHHHHHQSNLPVARVNPQTNSNIPPLQQQPRKSTETIEKQLNEQQHQQNLQQRPQQPQHVKPCPSVFSHQMYPPSPSFVMADGSMVFHNGGYPYVLLPGPAGPYYMSREFPPEHLAALHTMPINPVHHHPNAKFIPAASSPPVSSNCEKPKSVHVKNDTASLEVNPVIDTTASESDSKTQLADVTFPSTAAVAEAGSSSKGVESTQLPAAADKNQKDNSKDGYREKSSTTATSSTSSSKDSRRFSHGTNGKRKKHRQPLLPDPDVPKFSEMANIPFTPQQGVMPPTALVGLHPFQGQYHPHQQQQQQQPLHHSPQLYNNPNNPPVFQNPPNAPAPVFLQQVPAAAPHTPPIVSSHSSTPSPGTLAKSPSGGTSKTNDIGNSCSSQKSSQTTKNSTVTGNEPAFSPGAKPYVPGSATPGSMVECVSDPSGLVIFGPQPPFVERDQPQMAVGLPAMATDKPVDSESEETKAFGGQMPMGNPASVVYVQDASGALVAVNAALLQSQMDMMPVQGVYPRTDNPYLLPGPAPPGMDPGADPMASASLDANSPAMVRMVSSNGPPAPLPMQVPPGHMVQQIVDENGVLTHVILSSQPPGPGNPMSVGPYGGPANGSQYYTSYGGPGPYPPTPPQYTHHPHSVPPHMHGGLPHIQPSTNPACNNHVPVPGPGASPPLNSTDERTLRTRNRVRKKLQQRRSNTEGYYSNPPRSQGGRRNRAAGVNGDSGVMHGDMGMGHGQCGTPENGPMDPEEENTLITQCLSTMPVPKVTDVESRIALIQLSALECDHMDLELHTSDLKYELLLSDKGREAKYKTVYCGEATEITLRDLKPATEYHLKVCAVLSEELKGSVTEPVSFRTPHCEPDKPQPPKLMAKTRTSISLKWNATSENGSKILSYLLECDQGSGDGNFYEVYTGTTRQFRMSNLNASTRYVFRLAAQNSLGTSQYSDCVGFLTSGSVPSQPDPPMLSEQYVYALTISWIRRPNDEEFLLQMEDEPTGHGFIPVYNGPNLSYKVNSLRRNAEYRFRLCARNEEGQSKWSETVTFRTRPDRPLCPSKPQIKGKIYSHSFRITWDPPSDSGGAEINKYIVELDDGQGYDVVYEGSAREHLFDQLGPGHTYRVRVACCSVGGRSEFSDCCVATTLPIVPGQCQAPKLQGKPKATSLHLRWSYPDYDGGSQVTSFAAQMISPDNSSREVYKGHDLDCIVAGLLPGRPYLFQIRAFNRAGAGPWSDPLEVISGAGVPDTPRAPHVVCRSPHSALVSWEEPFNNGANITEYRLEWQQKSESADFSQLHVGPSLFFDAKGLLPATFYSFRIQAINSAGPGPFSPSCPYVSPPSSPSPIVSIKASPKATSALLTWREPNSNGSDITSYNIDVNDRPIISVDPVTEYLLEELLPETTYKIRVQAVNGIGVGAYSSAVKVTTKALPPSPPRLECVLNGPSSIKLKWGEGRNPDLLTYTLEMEKEDGSFQPVYTGPAHTHKVNRLSELTCYEFRLFASNEAGRGPYSDTYSFNTTKTPPPALKAPKAQSNSPNSCSLEWQAVKPMGADTVHYILQTMCLNGRDTEYKQTYKGPNNSFQLDNLQPHSEYQARVAAIRLASDGSGDITGAFSPGVVFSPVTPEPQKSSAESGTSRERQIAERRLWTDNEQAVVILLAFAIVTIIVAFLCQHLVIYQPEAADSSASSSSYSSSSSPPSSS